MKKLLLALLLLGGCRESPAVRLPTEPASDAASEPASDARADAATTVAIPDATVDPSLDAGLPTAPDAALACVASAGDCSGAPCCAGTFCDDNAYLETWQTCVPALADGERCHADLMCSGGHCLDGVCGSVACSAADQPCFGLDAPCCAGLACDVPADSYGPGSCAPVRGLGEPCAGDAQCASGVCTVGRCDAPAPAGPASFQRVFDEVVVRNGCANRACHGLAPGAGGLSLATIDEAYAALVGPTSLGCAPAARVEIGRPEASVLWRKIAPGVTACGAKMPPAVGAVSPAAAELVHAWITAGALR